MALMIKILQIAGIFPVVILFASLGGRFFEKCNKKMRRLDGDIHTNTLEGFWGLLKRAWYGQHHKYKVQYMPLYVAEAVWKYNNRKRENFFDFFVKGCFA